MKQITYPVGRCHVNETETEEKQREAVEAMIEAADKDGDESK
jgi:hypothetical protein